MIGATRSIVALVAWWCSTWHQELASFLVLVLVRRLRFRLLLSWGSPPARVIIETCLVETENWSVSFFLVCVLRLLVLALGLGARLSKS